MQLIFSTPISAKFNRCFCINQKPWGKKSRKNKPGVLRSWIQKSKSKLSNGRAPNYSYSIEISEQKRAEESFIFAYRNQFIVKVTRLVHCCLFFSSCDHLSRMLFSYIRHFISLFYIFIRGIQYSMAQNFDVVLMILEQV